MFRVYPNEEFRVRRRYEELKKGITQKGLNRSIYKEALDSYFSGNYRAAYVLSYIDVITPIAINAKRLYKRKKTAKDAFEFKIHKYLEYSIFLKKETKEKLSKQFEFTFNLGSKSKIKTWGYTRLRNASVHPEDEWHYLAITQINYQEYAILLLDLAHNVHEEYNEYLSSKGKQKRKNKNELNTKNYPPSTIEWNLCQFIIHN